ncbi:ferredoxin family protein [Collinsella tanakaei]|nr:ferredoxin family protein [Collinsella tanakaei]
MQTPLLAVYLTRPTDAYRLSASDYREETTMAHPVIDADECIACGVCVDACPAGVLELNDVATVADEDSCVACGACQDACPAGAITEIVDE